MYVHMYILLLIIVIIVLVIPAMLDLFPSSRDLSSDQRQVLWAVGGSLSPWNVKASKRGLSRMNPNL